MLKSLTYSYIYKPSVAQQNAETQFVGDLPIICTFFQFILSTIDITSIHLLELLFYQPKFITLYLVFLGLKNIIHSYFCNSYNKHCNSGSVIRGHKISFPLFTDEKYAGRLSGLPQISVLIIGRAKLNPGLCFQFLLIQHLFFSVILFLTAGFEYFEGPRLAIQSSNSAISHL